MTESAILKAEKRTKTGTRVTRKERDKGRIPAIIYGHKQEPVAISLVYHDLMMELQRHHRLLQIDLEGARDQYLLKEVQYNYLGDRVVHVDLTRVDANERVTVTVEVTLKGEPKGAHEGGVLSQVLTEVELECLVTAIPETLRVSVVELGVGQTLTAGQIELPAGARLVTDPSVPIAIVRLVTEAEPVEAAAAEEGAGSEPEVIKRDKTEDEEA